MIQKNEFRLFWSCILKVMNFLVFKDFSRIFLDFILDLVGFLKIKKSSYYRALTWRQNEVSPRGDVYMCHVSHVCVGMCMCASVCVRARSRGISGLSIH